jgi:hypothetical protein
MRKRKSSDTEKRVFNAKTDTIFQSLYDLLTEMKYTVYMARNTRTDFIEMLVFFQDNKPVYLATMYGLNEPNTPEMDFGSFEKEYNSNITGGCFFQMFVPFEKDDILRFFNEAKRVFDWLYTDKMREPYMVSKPMNGNRNDLQDICIHLSSRSLMLTEFEQYCPI